ncbi:hypothetical protein TTHERM_00673360 (macronuclear) [Tetrahymena thermophila SB210]|uniref:Uncharacterized protein n=1 Tax=Tetrahymena thermophila (strain SB210) TaxID=312017 RepID=Q23E23_TETTS|nr:hypothetical protein TTHERM_00673360 [Tetrahymena thermophila SB210]EAR94764.2 hypothetical protein TTHERM_00673360 [Tetrahymena thermophila SB210]|eukprot:XP_001015009.2 hypothetical protein TTHERM_00673360 [Tetrahymena thermophila SB210]
MQENYKLKCKARNFCNFGFQDKKYRGEQDSNLQPSDPQSEALPLSHHPKFNNYKIQIFTTFFKSLNEQDSNLQPSDPQSDALPLSHHPKFNNYKIQIFTTFFKSLNEQDSNLQPSDPQSDALPLSHHPKYSFLVLFSFFSLEFIAAESIENKQLQNQSQLKLLREQICLNEYKEYFYSNVDIYDISKCRDKQKCLSNIHIEFSKCNSANNKENNQTKFFNCIDGFLQKIGDCKHCICDLFQDFYLCQGGSIWQHQNENA